MHKDSLSSKDKKLIRALEILPGAISWSLIIFPIWGSLVVPVAVAYYIIAFDIYWLYRSFWTAALSLLSYYRIKASQQFDWLGEARSFLEWDKVKHIVIIPTFQEPLYILERTLNGLAKQTFPLKNLTVMVSFETREGEAARTKARALKQKFAHIFGNFLITYHPDLAGEVKGKSSNTAWYSPLRSLINGARTMIRLPSGRP
ncbi:hypothetical protein KKH13_02030 [Patescibacteria group bacterium]|nr:hypothetical protein [Patescibacteria group bacterium]